MSTLLPYECRHTIPGDVIIEKAARLINLLVASGEDPVGLFEDDFVQVVSRQAMWDRVGRAHDLGLDLGSPRMEKAEAIQREEARWTVFPGSQPAIRRSRPSKALPGPH